MRELILKLTILGEEYDDVHKDIIMDDFFSDLVQNAKAQFIEFEVKDFNNIPESKGVFMSEKGKFQLQKKEVCRICLLAIALEKQKVEYAIHVYPKTIEEYEKCREAWSALEEIEQRDSGREVLIFKNAIFYKPSN